MRQARLRHMGRWLASLGLIALLLGVVTAMGSGRAHACSCGPFPPPAVAAIEADIVFIGTAVVGTYGEYRTTRFEVSTVLKGPHHEVILVQQGRGHNCDIALRGQESYLVYAYLYPGAPGNTDWFTNSCLRTRSLVHAQEDVEEIEASRRGTALSPWGVRALAAGVVVLFGAGIVTIRRRSEDQRA